MNAGSVSPSLEESDIEIEESLRPLGNQFFDSRRSLRIDVLAVVMSIGAIAFGLVAISSEVETWNTANAVSISLALCEVVLSAAVAYWASYISIGLARVRKQTLGPLPPGIRRPAALWNHVRGPDRWPARSRESVPVAWRSPMAASIIRVQPLFVVMSLISALALTKIPVQRDGSAAELVIVIFASVAGATLISISAPIVLIDITRRRFRAADISTLDGIEPGSWARRSISIAVGIALLVATFVNFFVRLERLLNPIAVVTSRHSATVKLPPGHFTVFASCTRDVVCDYGAFTDVTVTDVATDRKVTITDDTGVDHQSFNEHPWISIANLVITENGVYQFKMDQTALGHYALGRAAPDIWQAMFPLIAELLWRIVAVWLSVAAIREVVVHHRRNKFSSRPTHP